jgi:hypothetical protein
MAKLLSAKYKTREGAGKRCRFENAIAKSEFDRGDKAKHYRYMIEYDGEFWRVARHNPV